MTPAARVAAAIEVLDLWRSGQPAERALTGWARGARYAGSKDRAAVRDLVYEALRRKGIAAALGGGETGRNLLLGLLKLRGEDAEDVFTGVRHAPAELTAEERAGFCSTAEPTPSALDFPDWLQPELARRATEPEALFAALSARAPVWLRVCTRRGDVAKAQAALRSDGITVQTTPLCETALQVTENARRIKNAAAYRDGLVELQDLSAQRAVQHVAWPEEGAILDYCAGGGGKALAIADRSRAQVLAHDTSSARMADIAPRAARADAAIKILRPGDAGAHAPYAAVLCDVPCSGSGTWRRDPETKWRLTPERLRALCTTQAQILDAAAPLVAPGGMLVYMTCSLFEAENEAQIAAFLARKSGWVQETQHLDTPLTASDGFFTSVLRRAPGG